MERDGLGPARSVAGGFGNPARVPETEAGGYRRRRRPATRPRPSSRPNQLAAPPLPWPPTAQPQPWFPPPRWPTLVTVGAQRGTPFGPSLKLQVPVPSGLTPQVQQSLGQLMVAQGSAMQALAGSVMAVFETQVSPAGHWMARQWSGRAGQRGRVADLALRADRARRTDRPRTCRPRSVWSAAHIDLSQRSTQVPFEQYWLPPQVIPWQGSSWHWPSRQSWPFLHSKPGS